MPKNKMRANDVERQLHHLEREMAKIAPPKVENEEFTVIENVQINADAGTVAGVPRISRLGVTGNGWYSYSTTSATPITPPRVAQVE